jgi:hypothetical protein
VLARPAGVLDDLAGYGIPQPVEQEAAAQRAQQRSERIREEWAELRQRTRSALPTSQREALAQVEDNLAFIGKRLRALNAEAGSLLPERL